MKRVVYSLLLASCAASNAFAVDQYKLPAPGQAAVQRQAMPGIGTMPGEVVQRSNVVPVTGEETVPVDVSATYMNRIATPFARAKVIDATSGEDKKPQLGEMVITANGSSVYVHANGATDAQAIYITGDQPGDPVISLLLIPKSIPNQVIPLQLNGGASIGGLSTSGLDARAKSDVYTDQLVYALRTLASGGRLQGYAEGYMPSAVAAIGEVSIRPLSRHSGAHYDIYRYRVSGPADRTVELQEPSFWAEGVRGVAFFPSSVVGSGAETDLFVVADKSATGQGGMQ